MTSRWKHLRNRQTDIPGEPSRRTNGQADLKTTGTLIKYIRMRMRMQTSLPKLMQAKGTFFQVEYHKERDRGYRFNQPKQPQFLDLPRRMKQKLNGSMSNRQPGSFVAFCELPASQPCVRQNPETPGVQVLMLIVHLISAHTQPQQPLSIITANIRLTPLVNCVFD